MGIFNFFRSSNKSKLMKKMIKTMDITYYNSTNGFNNNIPSKEERERTYREFFEYISNDYILGNILNQHNVTYEKFKFYIELMNSNGWGWNNGRYIPVDVFSFGKEMRYFLTSIENNEKMEMIYSNLIRKNY